tara:strand:- start:4628 stop:5356 length:729 start_codon:yes stop_codon:yes gene_type:complete
LTQEHAQLLLLLREEYKKKKLLHFKSQSWLQDIEDEEDEEAVAALNLKVLATIPTPITCDDDFNTNARIHKTNSMNELVFRDGEILGPEAIYYRKTSEIDVIFCERVTSYTKTFDMTFVIGSKTETHSCMDRKKLKDICAWAKENSLCVYETGPDPLPWKRMFAYHKDQTWEEIHRQLTHVSSEEEEASEWEEGMTDPEDEEDHDFDEDTESEEEYLSEETDEESEPSTKRRRILSDSDNDN